MNKKTVVVIACAFMLLSTDNSYAGLFARGGGESRTISSISPATVFNATSQTVILSGRFSKKQGRDRRVVMSQDRLPRPFPVRVYEWKRDRIRVEIPAAIQPDRYHIFLERAYHQNGRTQWRAISNKKAFEVHGSAHTNRNGTPHAAPITVADAAFCTNHSTVSRWVRGGPFQINGQNFPIRAELRASPPLPSYTAPPMVEVKHADLLEVRIPCFLTIQDPTLELRLIYPDGSTSNWAPVADRAIRDVSRRPRNTLGTVRELHR